MQLLNNTKLINIWPTTKNINLNLKNDLCQIINIVSSANTVCISERYLNLFKFLKNEMKKENAQSQSISLK